MDIARILFSRQAALLKNVRLLIARGGDFADFAPTPPVCS